MNLSLEGKNAVICGSSQGIGAAIAVELALMGANCTLLARNEEGLKTVVASLDSTLSQTHRYHSIDFADEETLHTLLPQLVADGPVHILVNNTGGPAAGPIVAAKE